MPDAAAALGEAPRRVFLTVGRLEIGAFCAAPQHRYLVRSIEPIGDALKAASVAVIAARGPFEEDAERALMRAHGIEILVTKNAGGEATYAKLAAARALGLPAIVVRQPEKPAVATTADVEAALRWLDVHARAP